MRAIKKFAVLALFTLGSALQAQTLSSTYTYSNLNWTFSTGQSGFTGCTNLFVDATGDIYNSDSFSAYGQLYCPGLGGSYASFGTAYFDASNNFNMTVTLGPAYQLVCTNLSGATLSGSCTIYNNNGTSTGTAFISF